MFRNSHLCYHNIFTVLYNSIDQQQTENLKKIKERKTHLDLRSSEVEEGVTNHGWVNHGRLPRGSDPELGFGN